MTISYSFLVLPSGQRFGRLVIIGRGEDKGIHARWNCVCDCGGKTLAMGLNLRRGATLSCGCYKREVTAKMAPTYYLSMREAISALPRPRIRVNVLGKYRKPREPRPVLLET